MERSWRFDCRMLTVSSVCMQVILHEGKDYSRFQNYCFSTAECNTKGIKLFQIPLLVQILMRSVVSIRGFLFS